MVICWNFIIRDYNGDLYIVFFKVIVLLLEDQFNDFRKVVGFVIWVQLFVVDGYGDKFVEDFSIVMDLNELYLGDKVEYDYFIKLNCFFYVQCMKVVKNKVLFFLFVVFVLDMCVVDLVYQGCGIVKEFVKWGIVEVECWGNFELVMEGFIMGCRVYEKFGFKFQWLEIVYEFDFQFEL